MAIVLKVHCTSRRKFNIVESDYSNQQWTVSSPILHGIFNLRQRMQSSRGRKTETAFSNLQSSRDNGSAYCCIAFVLSSYLLVHARVDSSAIEEWMVCYKTVHLQIK